LAGTKLYCLVTEAHRCEQLVVTQLLPRVGFERTTCWSQLYRATLNAVYYIIIVITILWLFSFSA